MEVGVESRKQVKELTDAGADTIVVGNIFHEIASEEFALYHQSRSERISEEPWRINDFEEWLYQNCSISDTAAARYLSTTSVNSVEETAIQMIAETLAVYDGIEQVLSEYPDRSPEEKRRIFLSEYSHYDRLLHPEPKEYLDSIFMQTQKSAMSEEDMLLRHTPVTRF